MKISTQKFTDITKREPWWARYSFAVATCVLGILLDLSLDRVMTDRIYPFLPAVAAIIASAAWAGAGPGIAATALMVIWTAVDLSHHGFTPSNNLLRCALLAVEGVLLSFGSARMWRSMRVAALSEAWHRRLVETAAEGIWVHDETGVITYANARMAEMLGVGLEELIGRNVEEFFLPADRSVERIRAANLRNGRKEQFDRRLRRQDGSEIWVLTCCNLINDGLDSGSEPGSLAMMTDITQRKQAEHALRRSEERFRDLFEGVLEGVYQSAPDGRIIAANPVLLKMLGLANEAELNDVDFARDLYVDPNVRRQLFDRLDREGRYQNVEHDLRRRDGRIISVLENARVVRDAQGAVLYYEGTLTDITPRKRIEEQLLQARKVEALGRLAGSVAHDFDNALTIITGFAQLALSDLPDPHPARSSIEHALEAAERAMALTRQLLLFSRRQAPADGVVDLNHAVEAARQPGMAVSLCRQPIPIYGKSGQIEPVIRDLCASARRSFPSSSVAIKTEPASLDAEFCRRYPSALPGLYAVLSLGNSIGGSAIGDPCADPLLSELQADECAEMDLSAAYETVAQCGGFIVADGNRAAAPAGVSRFHVFLPCAMEAGDSTTRVASDASRETILLVEDEPLIRELSRDMLERQGYRVMLASNAKEAEQIGAGTGSFDLLITDTVMPNITGAELARRLRASHPGMKVLFIAGYADDAPGSGEMGPEGAAFLQKPFSADSLGRKIRQMLNRA